jgi:hypothetical protein
MLRLSEPGSNRVWLRFQGRKPTIADVSNLFPDKPDYVGMPLISEEVDPRAPIVGVVMTGTFLGLCPAVHEEHHHVPHQEHATDLGSLRGSAWFGSGSTSSIAPQPFFGMADDGSMAVIQRHYARRQAAHTVASSMSSTSFALLNS